MLYFSSFLNAYLKFGCVLKIILKWKWKKKDYWDWFTCTEPQKRVALIGKERCNIVGGIALTCVCGCVVCVWYALPPLRFPGFTFPHVSLPVFFFCFFFNLCVVCVCVCLGIALHSCPFNQLTSSTNQAPVAFFGSLWIVHSLMWA